MTPELLRRIQRLEALAVRLDDQARGDPQLGSDLGRLLCVEASGFVESTVRVIIDRFVSTSDPRLRRVVNQRMKRFYNPTPNRLASLLSDFSLDWEDAFNQLLDAEPEWKDGLESVVAIKNQVAHGGGGSVGISSALSYTGAVVELVKRLDSIIA